MKDENWGPGAPKVPLRSKELEREAKRDKYDAKKRRQADRLEQSRIKKPWVPRS